MEGDLCENSTSFMYLAGNTCQAKEIPAGGLVVQGYGYGNRLMIETGFLVSSRHKQRDILKAKVSQELSLKLSLETVVRENASGCLHKQKSEKVRASWKMPAAFFPRFVQASMHSFRVKKLSCRYFMFPNFSMKEQHSLQKQIQGLLSFEERMILYSNNL